MAAKSDKRPQWRNPPAMDGGMNRQASNQEPWNMAIGATGPSSPNVYAGNREPIRNAYSAKWNPFQNWRPDGRGTSQQRSDKNPSPGGR